MGCPSIYHLINSLHSGFSVSMVTKQVRHANLIPCLMDQIGALYLADTKIN